MSSYTDNFSVFLFTIITMKLIKKLGIMSIYDRQMLSAFYKRYVVGTEIVNSASVKTLDLGRSAWAVKRFLSDALLDNRNRLDKSRVGSAWHESRNLISFRKLDMDVDYG